MAKRRHDYQPSEEYAGLFPDISANTINGLGEREPRKPSPVFWHEPDTIPHGNLQNYFYENAAKIAEYRKESTRGDNRGPEQPAPIADIQAENTPRNWSAQVKAFALANEADMVGIARVREDWVFEGHKIAEPWVILLGVVMDHEKFSRLPPVSPDFSSADEVSRQYNRAARASRAAANWIRGQGWEATAQTGPMAGSMPLIPAAIEAGFGQLGKHGSMINGEHGACFRLSGVLTQMPLEADTAVDPGVDDFCLSCRVCRDACPPDAIFETKQWVRGFQKWYVNFDKCLPYFHETYGCGICIAVCPWSRPGIAPGLSAKMLRRRQE